MHETEEGVIAGTIIETEAYDEKDEASHSFGGRKTRKNETMFAEGGHLYVYFTYGMHYCMNIVAGNKGTGSAVLLRAVHIHEGKELAQQNRLRNRKNKDPISEKDIANGPGKLCQAFNITGAHNGALLTQKNTKIYLQTGRHPDTIRRTPRIGIAKGKEKLWRFIEKTKGTACRKRHTVPKSQK